jgi:hypothetical protein
MRAAEGRMGEATEAGDRRRSVAPRRVRLAHTMVSDLGYEVLAATRGEEALDARVPGDQQGARALPGR